jgi:hypothetical protein
MAGDRLTGRSDMAKKPMGQDEKDRIGQAEMDARRAEERGEASEGLVDDVPDDELDDLTRDRLVAVAATRGIDIRSGVTKPQIIEVLRQHPERAGAEQAKQAEEA